MSKSEYAIKFHKNPDIYQIIVPLPHNPLGKVNTYVIKGEERSLLIDTGFNMPECKDAVEKGLTELGLTMEDMDIFVTHIHSDHLGLAGAIASDTTTIYMGETEYNYYKTFWQDNDEDLVIKRYGKSGATDDWLREVSHSFDKVLPASVLTAVTVADGEKISYGGYDYTAVVTPGHTTGHVCLYQEEHQILFTGDHVLFDITPNIVLWIDFPNPLEQYLKSLRMIQKLPVKTCMPGHRIGFGGQAYTNRIDEIIEHHKLRLKETASALQKLGPTTAFELAGHLVWSLKGRTWEQAPDSQKWFAVGETLSHLEYLVEEGTVEKNDMGIYKYK